MSVVLKFEVKGSPETGYVLFKTTEQIGRDKLACFQKLVGGLIEPIAYLTGAALLMNEEALNMGLVAWRVPDELEALVPDHFIVSGVKVLVGPVIFVADDGEDFMGFQDEFKANEALIGLQ
ncbi:DUF3846 domain-containing protein [Shewanella sp.]|uniref:DUF3846 domain-containing protein n=1 Tax=Shewanella sp. TaxID=50422 RepID=UPI0040476B11